MSPVLKWDEYLPAGSEGPKFWYGISKNNSNHWKSSKSYREAIFLFTTNSYGQVAEWSMATDCKSVDLRLRRFKSFSAHQFFKDLKWALLWNATSRNISRASGRPETSKASGGRQIPAYRLAGFSAHQFLQITDVLIFNGVTVPVSFGTVYSFVLSSQPTIEKGILWLKY